MRYLTLGLLVLSFSLAPSITPFSMSSAHSYTRTSVSDSCKACCGKDGKIKYKVTTKEYGHRNLNPFRHVLKDTDTETTSTSCGKCDSGTVCV